MKGLQKNLRILVVEDNPGDLVLIREYLTEGMEISEIDHAATYAEAKKIITKNKQFDAILLDLSLPDLSGEDLVKKTIELAGKTPVVVLTGYENQEFGLKTLSWGVSDYLLKDECNPFVLTKVVSYSIERNKIQREVISSEKKYRDFFNLSPLPMWVYDLETLRFLDVNQAAIDEYDYSRDEFLDMTIEEIRPKAEISNLRKIIDYTAENDLSIWEGEVKHQKKDKTVFDVIIKSTRIDHHGKESKLVVAEDISERNYYSHLEKLERDILEKNALNELNIKELAEQFVLGIEKLHPGTRCSVTKIINNKLSDFASSSLPREYLKIIDGVEIGPNAGSCGAAAFLKEQVISENIFTDLRWKQYKHLGEQYNFSACWSQPVFNNKGDVVATFAVYYEKPNKPSELELNTVERAAHILRILFESYDKEIAENKLALSESKYKSIVQDGADLIAILDEEGAYKYVSPNRRDVLGIPPEDFMREVCYSHIHEEDVQRVREILTSLKPGERKYIKPYRFKFKDYQEFWIETTITNLLDTPSINGYLANSRDVTARKKYEEEIQSSLAEKETLLSEIHHRVKNNLAVISGMMQLQAFESDNPDLQEKLYDSVFRIKTMATVHELLYETNSFSKLDFTKTLETLVRSVSETLEPGSNVEIQFNSLPIQLNINQAIPLSLIVNEVITNAYKHAFDSETGGVIKIDLQMSYDSIELQISDNGYGLPKDFDKNNLSSMGLKLINVLSNQINAMYDYHRLDSGTKFSIAFKKAEIKGTGNVHML